MDRMAKLRNLHLYGRGKETWNIRKWGILLNGALMGLSIFSIGPVYAASTGVHGCNIPKLNTILVPALVTASLFWCKSTTAGRVYFFFLIVEQPSVFLKS